MSWRLRVRIVMTCKMLATATMSLSLLMIGVALLMAVISWAAVTLEQWRRRRCLWVMAL